MAIRPCTAWKMPDMISMMAANRMKPTAQALVSRSARDGGVEYSLVIWGSLLCSAAGHAGGPHTDDRAHHRTGPGKRASPFWDEVSSSRDHPFRGMRGRPRRRLLEPSADAGREGGR